MAALWSSSSMVDVHHFPASQLIGFLCNHQMLQLFQRPQWKTVQGRSKQYTERMYEILGGEDRVHLSTPIASMIQKTTASTTQYELFTSSTTTSTTTTTSVGIYDHVVFACHPPTSQHILKESPFGDGDGVES